MEWLCTYKIIKYNMCLLQVLTGKDVAVRMALGETQIVSETKQFLLDNGVNLNMFNQVVSLFLLKYEIY